MRAQLKPLSDARFVQAESPRWDSRSDELIWVDHSTGRLHCGRFASGRLIPTRSYRVGKQIGFAAPSDSGGWIVAAGRDLIHVAENGALSTLIQNALPEGHTFNDGGVDPKGRIWAGSQSLPRGPHCGLFSLDRDGQWVKRLDHATVSNGLAFSDDGYTLYYIDTLPHHSIDVFSVEEGGSLSHRRRLVVVEGGNPDGMCIDAAGNLWVAVWDAGEVRQYSPSGGLICTLKLAARRPTAVTIAGKLLVVTSASVGLANPGPDDGAIFGIELEVGAAEQSVLARIHS